MVALDTIVVFLYAASAMLICVGVAIVSTKALRNQREEIESRQRIRLEAALLVAQESILVNVFRDISGQSTKHDLAVALDNCASTLSEARWNSIHHAVSLSGFETDLRRSLRSKSAAKRGLAVRLVSALRISGREQIFAQMIDDSDQDVLLTILGGLSSSKNPRVVDTMLSLLHHGVSHSRIAERAAQPQFLERLITLLVSDDPLYKNPAVRCTIAETLGLIGDCSAEPFLIQMLQTGKDEERLVATRALANTALPGNSRTILEDLLRADDWRLRAQAAISLGKLGDHRSSQPLQNLLDDPNWCVRRDSGSALRQLGATGIAALKNAATHSDRYARERAHEEISIIKLRKA